MMYWMWIGRQVAFGFLDVAAFYGALPTIVCVLLLFSAFIAVDVNVRYHKIVQNIAMTVMGVYIIHPFVLSIWVKFLPIVTKNSVMNLFYWIGVIVCSEILVCIIRKIPVLRELIKI